MNRIVVGSGNNIEKILNDKVVINVKEDTNLLINNNKYETYEINVNDANVNILFMEENVKKTNVLINVKLGYLTRGQAPEFPGLTHNGILKSYIKLRCNIHEILKSPRFL